MADDQDDVIRVVYELATGRPVRLFVEGSSIVQEWEGLRAYRAGEDLFVPAEARARRCGP